MGETLKATIVGTIIIGIFMLISVKMAIGSVETMALKTRAYIETQKVELKQIVKAEQKKAKDVALQAACMTSCPMAKKTK
ncbi:MAG: hypothetical protein PHC61_15975 [Chitinivibrionales bacterium]|nr:hypothetical protein [Chitinivibrionales bacterium]